MTPIPSFRLACVQFRPDVGQNDGNRARTVALIEEAVRRGASLVVLPELSSSGYQFESRDEALAAGEPLSGGPTVAAWTEVAHEHGIHVVGGVAERDGDRLYNSSVVIGPSGLIGSYRKTHLWNAENTIFTPGDLGFPVFDTALGRLSVLICYDGWFPETYRACALGGADLICVPTNWVPMSGLPAGAPAMATILTQAAAHSNGVYIAAADRIGVERGQAFIGQSVIVADSGQVLAGPASSDAEEIIFATIDVEAARARRTWNQFNNPITDRRPEIYDSLTQRS
jgi:N-carbamoylputrescine amidase